MTGLFEKRLSPIHGMGLFALVPLVKGQRLAGYEGEEMTLAEFKKRYGNDIRYTYSLRRLNRIISGKGYDNPSHWCNESATPNCCLRRRGLYTLRAIEVGEELTLAYPKNYPRDYAPRNANLNLRSE